MTKSNYPAPINKAYSKKLGITRLEYEVLREMWNKTLERLAIEREIQAKKQEIELLNFRSHLIQWIANKQEKADIDRRMKGAEAC